MNDKIESPFNFMLVHGYVLHEDEGLDKILIDRLDFALTLVNLVENVIVCGKHGNRDEEFYRKTKVTESSVMRQYLIDNDVRGEIIYEEDEGTNTFDCTKNAYDKIIHPKEWNSGIIVSSAEHIPRIALQSLKIFPVGMNLSYWGPSIENEDMRKGFLENEAKAIAYTASRQD